MAHRSFRFIKHVQQFVLAWRIAMAASHFTVLAILPQLVGYVLLRVRSLHGVSIHYFAAASLVASAVRANCFAFIAACCSAGGFMALTTMRGFLDVPGGSS